MSETTEEQHARARDVETGWCQCHDGSPLCPHCDALASDDEALQRRMYLNEVTS